MKPRRGEVWLVDLGLAAKMRPIMPTMNIHRLTTTALVILFGALPASLWAYFAGIVFAVGLYGITENPWQGLQTMAWGAGGVLGTLALWITAFKIRFQRRLAAFAAVACLIAGVCAMAPLALGIFVETISNAEEKHHDYWGLYFLFSPLVVGIIQIVRVLRQNLRNTHYIDIG